MSPPLPGALLLFGFGLALALCLTTGCERSSAEREAPLEAPGEKAASGKVIEEAASQPYEVVRSAELPERPERIVSLAPNVTELLFAIGAGPRVVAVTRFCDRPAQQVARLPKIGGFVDPELEPIAAQRPDLIVGVTSAGDPAFARQLDAAGLGYLYLPMEDLEQTYAGIEQLGRATDQQAGAQELVARMRAQMAAVEPTTSKPRVLFVFGHRPLVAAGPGTFADELISRAGGVNVVEGELPYPTLDLEKIVELRPDVILDASTIPGSETGSELANGPEAEVAAFWSRFEALPAVAKGRVHAFEEVSLLRPGPGLPQALELIAAQLRSADPED